MTKSPRLSVVIPTWNRATLLPACLESVVHQTLAPDEFEIVVVDDGSTDNTAAVVEAVSQAGAIPPIRYVYQSNGGLNQARNAGVAAARGDAVAFVDDDELLPSTHLERSLALLAEHPECAGVGGPAVDDGSAIVRTCQHCSLGSAQLPMTEAGVAPCLLGGNMVLRTDALERTGPFAAALSGRGDESEWFARAKLDFWYDPALFVWHRRDHMTMAGLTRAQFRQGRALPRAARLAGGRFRPRPRRLVRAVAHASLRRCARGVALAARELGATWEWIAPSSAPNP